MLKRFLCLCALLLPVEMAAQTQKIEGESVEKGTDELKNIVNFPPMAVPIFVDGKIVAYYKVKISVETDGPETALDVRRKLPRIVDDFFVDLFHSLRIGVITGIPYTMYRDRLQRILKNTFPDKKKTYLYLNQLDAEALEPYDTSTFVTGTIQFADSYTRMVEERKKKRQLPQKAPQAKEVVDASDDDEDDPQLEAGEETLSDDVS